MKVAGVDGCPGGWLVVRVTTGPKLRFAGEPCVVKTFNELIETTKDCAAVGVDIPIGLSEDQYWRDADLAARELLGARRNAVFAAPIRAVLGAESHPDACERSERITGKRISIQAYNILDKIEDANSAMKPDLQKRIVEVHPEVCFLALNDSKPMAYKKKRVVGRIERLEALSRWFSDDLANIAAPPGAARDDFLDACAAAWTAARVAREEAERLPQEPPLNARGLRMEIVY